MKYAYERERIRLRNPSISECVAVIHVEQWHWPRDARYPIRRPTPLLDALMTSKHAPAPPTLTRFLLTARG